MVKRVVFCVLFTTVFAQQDQGPPKVGLYCSTVKESDDDNDKGYWEWSEVHVKENSRLTLLSDEFMCTTVPFDFDADRRLNIKDIHRYCHDTVSEGEDVVSFISVSETVMEVRITLVYPSWAEDRTDTLVWTNQDDCRVDHPSFKPPHLGVYCLAPPYTSDTDGKIVIFEHSAFTYRGRGPFEGVIDCFNESFTFDRQTGQLNVNGTRCFGDTFDKGLRVTFNVIRETIIERQVFSGEEVVLSQNFAWTDSDRCLVLDGEVQPPRLGMFCLAPYPYDDLHDYWYKDDYLEEDMATGYLEVKDNSVRFSYADEVTGDVVVECPDSPFIFDPKIGKLEIACLGTLMDGGLMTFQATSETVVELMYLSDNGVQRRAFIWTNETDLKCQDRDARSPTPPLVGMYCLGPQYSEGEHSDAKIIVHPDSDVTFKGHDLFEGPLECENKPFVFDAESGQMKMTTKTLEQCYHNTIKNKNFNVSLFVDRSTVIYREIRYAYPVFFPGMPISRRGYAWTPSGQCPDGGIVGFAPPRLGLYCALNYHNESAGNITVLLGSRLSIRHQNFARPAESLQCVNKLFDFEKDTGNLNAVACGGQFASQQFASATLAKVNLEQLAFTFKTSVSNHRRQIQYRWTPQAACETFPYTPIPDEAVKGGWHVWTYILLFSTMLFLAAGVCGCVRYQKVQRASNEQHLATSLQEA